MPMFDDPRKELEQLQEQLLKDEDWFVRELDSAKAMIGDQPTPKKRKTAAAGAVQAANSQKKPQVTADPAIRNYANGYGASEPGQEVPEVPKKSNKGLIILALLENLGIAAIAAYWLIFLL